MGLRVEPGDLADRTSIFQQRAQRERARVKVLISIVEEVLAGSWSSRSSPVLAAQRVGSEAETSQVSQAAATAAGALAAGTRDALEAALEDLRWDEEGLAAQAGTLEPGLFDRLYLAALDNPVVEGVIVAGVAGRELVGADVPEAMNGRDQELVDKGKALSSWGLGLGIVALAIAAVAAALVYGGKR